MLKIGLVGLGHLGKIHLKLIEEIAEFNLVGIFDSDKNLTAELAKTYNCKAFESYEKMLLEVDAVDIVTPTNTHFNFIKNALRNFKHVFVEKPLSQNLTEAEEIVKLTEEAEVVLQVGHVERFNPAFLALKDIKIEPKFIESHRLASFNPRGTDVAVILDLMIHDIDIILKLVNSNVKKVHANGVSILSKTTDIANARVEFENGCVANLTASRMSLKNMRKMRIFQNDAYLSLDFLEKKSQIIQLNDTETENSLPINVNENEIKYLSINEPKIDNNNAIKDELLAFSKSVLNHEPIAVDVYDACKAMSLSFLILDKIYAASTIS